MSELEALLAEHEPVLGVFAKRAGIVGCSCLSARDYRAAGHQAGQRGWRAHVAAILVDHEAQIRDLLEEREELLTVIRRLRMGNHPAGRALRPEFPRLALLADAIEREALTERDAEHDGGEGREAVSR